MKFLLLAVLATAAGAQSPPSADLMPTMQKMVEALGVSCEYCHSAPRGSGLAEPKKEIARAMIAITRDLNAKIPDATHKTAGEAATIECVTCHRGVVIPRQLSEILSRTVREQGAAAAVEQYRDLRQLYYGRQAYDFGEGTLLDLGQRMAASKPGDAIALLKVNIEFNPKSTRSYSALAYAYTRKLDDASAISALEKALEIEPENGVIQGQLEQLKSFHRRK
jgi:tetratricopeptide (TPR) repeat protein